MEIQIKTIVFLAKKKCLNVVPLNKLEDGGEDGCFVNQKCMGSYIHGILDNQAFIDYLLEPYAEKLEAKNVAELVYKGKSLF